MIRRGNLSNRHGPGLFVYFKLLKHSCYINNINIFPCLLHNILCVISFSCQTHYARVGKTFMHVYKGNYTLGINSVFYILPFV